MAAARALELRAPLMPASGTAAVVVAIRERVAGIGEDRHLAPEIEAVRELVAGGVLVRAAEAAIGELE